MPSDYVHLKYQYCIDTIQIFKCRLEWCYKAKQLEVLVHHSNFQMLLRMMLQGQTTLQMLNTGAL